MIGVDIAVLVVLVIWMRKHDIKLVEIKKWFEEQVEELKEDK